MFKKEKKEDKSAWLIERRKIRMYNARSSAITDELEDYQHLSQYKERFKLLFEFYQLQEPLKELLKVLFICICDSV